VSTCVCVHCVYVSTCVCVHMCLCLCPHVSGVLFTCVCVHLCLCPDVSVSVSTCVWVMPDTYLIQMCLCLTSLCLICVWSVLHYIWSCHSICCKHACHHLIYINMSYLCLMHAPTLGSKSRCYMCNAWWDLSKLFTMINLLCIPLVITVLFTIWNPILLSPMSHYTCPYMWNMPTCLIPLVT